MYNRNFILGPIIVFTVTGIITAFFRANIYYFFGFTCLGSAVAFQIFLQYKGLSIRITRLIFMGGFAAFFLGYLSLYLGINFQFPALFFDFSRGMVSGALIQLIIARVVGPFIFGSSFCSRVCWNGFVFDVFESKCSKPSSVNSTITRLVYIGLIILLVSLFVISDIKLANINERRVWISGENLWIYILGFSLIPLLGGRAYCLYLCPFLTVSGLFSPYSRLKITGDKSKCNNCRMCEKKCPMRVPILNYIQNSAPVSHRDCILCETCVEACKKGLLHMNFIWKEKKNPAQSPDV